MAADDLRERRRQRRRPEAAGADLASVPSRHPDIHDRSHSGGGDPVDVDRDRHASEAEVGDSELGVLTDGDSVHREIGLGHSLDRPTLVVLQRECGGLREPAQADGLVQRALAAHELDFVLRMPFEELRPGHRRQRAPEPFLSESGDTDCEVLAVEHHRRDDA